MGWRRRWTSLSGTAGCRCAAFLHLCYQIPFVGESPLTLEQLEEAEAAEDTLAQGGVQVRSFCF